jgi:hypothetical protein
MLPLNRCSGNVCFPRGRAFLWRRLRDNSTHTTIVTDIGGCLIDNNILDVNIRDAYIRYVVDGAIIEKISVAPVSALIANAGVTKSIP